ncbi:unnamed protein product [marine sediment metagenome]|uniref:Uncharacterized protein n=1 Tax=marine sediment metagenome TaxID=412755 RepID=X0XLE6_9ZZZZ
MDDLIALILTALPPSVSAPFAAIIILGGVFIFFFFLHRFWKTYHESMSLDRDEEMNMSEKIYNKISSITDNYSGKYLTDKDLEKLKKEFREEIEDIYKEINGLKKKFGIR